MKFTDLEVGQRFRKAGFKTVLVKVSDNDLTDQYGAEWGTYRTIAKKSTMWAIQKDAEVVAVHPCPVF